MTTHANNNDLYRNDEGVFIHVSTINDDGDHKLKVRKIFNPTTVPRNGISKLHQVKEKTKRFTIEHENIMTFFALDYSNLQYSITEEHMCSGDLFMCLRNEIPIEKEQVSTGILHGLKYLYDIGVAVPHRNIRSSSIFLGTNHVPKIAVTKSYEFKKLLELYEVPHITYPPTHDAPEFFTRAFDEHSEKSDVWSYGMVLYEICMDGLNPFEEKIDDLLEWSKKEEACLSRQGRIIKQITVQLQNRELPFRMSNLPEKCNSIKNIMTECLKFDLDERPTFVELLRIITSPVRPPHGTGPLHRALRRHYSAFIRDMEPLDVAERLIQEDVITAEQLVDIQETQLTSDKRRYLLRILLQKTEQDLVVFKNALSDSLQAHLANLLV